MRLQQVHRQRRHQRTRKNVRRQHGEHHRLRQRHKQVPRHAAQEEHRQKHDADTKRRHQRRHRDLRRALEDRLMQPTALFQIALDVFDRHRRIVHQDADRQRQPAQRHDVDRLAQQAQHNDRRQDRQRNRHRDDDRAAPAPQEQQDHQPGQHRRDHRLANHPVHRSAHKHRLVADRRDFQLRRQRQLYPRQQIANAAHHISVEALPDFSTAISTPRWPSCRTMFVCGMLPSVTVATSCR